MALVWEAGQPGIGAPLENYAWVKKTGIPSLFE